MPSCTSPNTGGDFLVHRESEIVCIESAKLTNPTAGEANVDQIAGYPVELSGGKYNLGIATEEAATTGFVVHGPPIIALAAGEDTEPLYSILARGPAAINGDKFAPVDLAGADLTAADLAAAAEGLGLVVRYESPTQSVQES